MYPLGVAEGIEESLARQAKEKGYRRILIKTTITIKLLNRLKRQLGQYQLLDQPFMINKDDWLHKG